jgi:SAM-dependent methyltransferase
MTAAYLRERNPSMSSIAETVGAAIESGRALVLDPTHRSVLIDAGVDADRLVVVKDGCDLMAVDALHARGVDRLIVPAHDPIAWLATTAERDAQTLGLALEVVFPDAHRVYDPHDIGRLRYLKAYLRGMLTTTGSLAGLRLLEVGCSDGLTCDLAMRLGAASVVGIDTLPDVGARFQTDPALSYYRMSGEELAFETGDFDVVYSIATLEHVSRPEPAMLEMLRVTRPGGVVYMQAGPLYFSPFGHHMFGYFDDYPWIHLRLTPEQIIDEGHRRGFEGRLRAERGFGVEPYVRGMLTRDHINGLRLSEYGIDTVVARSSELLMWKPSYEGREVLTDAIAAEVPSVPRQCLTEHGFQVAVRR